ncbi:ABC transporter permease [Streptomyces sp. NPDC056600]|uniref:ABC transporter permease n=1 Tax=Streptomyces sp. NPDC056600 TaxID=3345874 RepID=UPI00368E91F4
MYRVHRWALWVWIAYVALGAGLLLWAGGPAANALAAQLEACPPDASTMPPACVNGLNSSIEVYRGALRLGYYLVLLAPLLAGGWAAASLTAREAETGTAGLAWTQSVTPARWLTAKLALPAMAVSAGTALLLMLYRRAHSAGEGSYITLWQGSRSRWAEDVFTGTGVVMVPRMLCAVAVGVLLGLLLRRTLASLGVGVALTAFGTVWFQGKRQLLWPTEIRYGYELGDPSPRWYSADDEWPLDSGAVTASGDRVGYNGSCLDAVHPSEGPAGDAGDFYACLKEQGLSDVWATYHPTSHFWPLQLVESGIWLAVAALAVILSYRVLRRRTA